MGTPKALALVDGVAMGRRVAYALTAAGAAPVVVQGGSRSVADALALDLVADDLPGAGPLAALASATSWAAGIGADLVVVAACDQPDLTAVTLRTMCAALDDLGSAQPDGTDGTEQAARALGAVPIDRDGRRHPFPAVWRTAAAPRLRALVTDGARRADAALTLGVVEVGVEATELADVDTPEALADRRRSAASDPGGTGP